MTEQAFPTPVGGKSRPTGSGCPVCGRDIVFSVYFDRFGFNAIDNEENLTNIGQLFQNLSYDNRTEITKALSSFRTTMNYKHYISGLGTPFKPERQFENGLSLVLDSPLDTIKDLPKDKAKEVGKEAVTGSPIRMGLKGTLKDYSGMSAAGWKKNWRLIKDHRSMAAGGLGVSAKRASKAARLAKKHTKDLLVGGARLGMVAVKGLLVDLIKAAALAGLDGTDFADISTISSLFRSGYKKRINDAWDALASVIRREKENIKPPTQSSGGEVRVFIFGADWGGTLARIFANKIVEECKKKEGKLSFEGIPVVIQFVGLFDCANSVTATRGTNFVASLTPLTESLDDTELPAEVQAAFHLYATHERRYMVASIAGDKAVTKEECALPGIAADVCGGKLLKSEYGLMHQDISKYALCQMHAVATAYGGPFGKPDDGTPQATKLEAALKPDFLLNGQDVYERLPEYQGLLGDLSAPPMDVIRKSAETYTKWLRTLYDESRQGRDLAGVLKTDGETSSSFLEAMQTQIQRAENEARRGLQLAERAWEHQLGHVWQSGEHLDDPILHAFLASYVHFNCPTLPLSYREVEVAS